VLLLHEYIIASLRRPEDADTAFSSQTMLLRIGGEPCDLALIHFPAEHGGCQGSTYR
jgi:hypothetical protein